MKIIFDISGYTPVAIGVEVESDGETFIVEGKEIVLSAGAIGSPQLLMLSGVGPKDHLKEFGIDCVLDSPGVGQNLSDHPLSHIQWATKPEVELDPFGSSTNLTQTILRYTADGSELENDMIVYMNVTTSQNISKISFVMSLNDLIPNASNSFLSLKKKLSPNFSSSNNFSSGILSSTSNSY